MTDPVLEHQAQRYQQIAALERRLTLQAVAVREAKEHVKELQMEHDAILSEIRTAARDEGELPLLDMMDDAVGRAS